MHIFAMLIEKLKKHLLRLAAGENNAFYINGTDVLPTPLSPIIRIPSPYTSTKTPCLVRLGAICTLR